ncbi:MAG: TetR/AcrR family transcriptional regulator [Myxococcaceae bacterium]|nr:TetR/AcrR family transcriptional regulator [Myxococcaceae bacterium]
MTTAGDHTRRALQRAAIEQFAARGFFGVTLPELGRAAGIGAATVYRHVDSKEALFNTVLRDQRQALDDALWSHVDTRRGPEDVLHVVWNRFRDFGQFNTPALVLLELRQHALPLEPSTASLLRRSPLEPLVPVLVRGQRTRVVREGSPEHLAEVVRGIFLASFKRSVRRLKVTELGPLLDGEAIAWSAIRA